MQRYYIIFRGHVQHCGFRYFTWKMSKKVGNLTGWVKNMRDGAVEMEVQGPEENIEKFLTRIKKGRDNIRVDEMEMKEIDIVPNEKMYQVMR